MRFAQPGILFMMKTYAHIRHTYLMATLLSMLLMLGGWLWHVFTRDQTNMAIIGGIGLLVITPLLALLHLCFLSWERDKRTFWNAVTVIVLVLLAFLVGKR